MFIPKPKWQENVCFLNRKVPPQRNLNAGCIIRKRKCIKWLLVLYRPLSPIAGVGTRVGVGAFRSSAENKNKNAFCIILGFGIQVG